MALENSARFEQAIPSREQFPHEFGNIRITESGTNYCIDEIYCQGRERKDRDNGKTGDASGAEVFAQHGDVRRTLEREGGGAGAGVQSSRRKRSWPI